MYNKNNINKEVEKYFDKLPAIAETNENEKQSDIPFFICWAFIILFPFVIYHFFGI